MTTIARDSLMTLEAYSKIRKSSRADAIAHRKLRSVQLGDHITCLLYTSDLADDLTPSSLCVRWLRSKIRLHHIINHALYTRCTRMLRICVILT